MEAFRLQALSFRYPEAAERALDQIDLTIDQGEFLVLCGPSGCGKSTLLRQLKTVLTPHGSRSGQILFEGKPLEEWGQREQSGKIGFVGQSPEHQVVTDKVWHELAFGLESLGYDTPMIRRRVAETASFFGIQSWFRQDVAGLSGGQKQLLSLAAVMAMEPSVLILDEPTSQLDPIAASDFLASLGKLNRELGTTVILSEHRLEEAFPLASRVAVMDRGRLLAVGSPRQAAGALKDRGHAMFLAMPAATRVWAAVESGDLPPVTVREGQDWLAGYAGRHGLEPLPAEQGRQYPPSPAGPPVCCQGLWFRYEKDLPDVVKGLSFSAQKGELLALLGGNGTGKTTCLKLLAGLLEPCRGQVLIQGRLGMLPQDPQTLFVRQTVGQDLWELLEGKGDRAALQDKVDRVAALCRLTGLLDRHPYDLSGGEQQRAALAKLLLLDPDILLLDEPTKGLDAGFKQSLGQILQDLSARGVTIVMVSHDVEFCAGYAHRCALFFDGDIVAQGTPRQFFSGNRFYTTAANRLAGAVAPQAVTVEDVIALCGGALPEPAGPEPAGIPPLPAPEADAAGLSWRRRLGAAVSGVAALFLLLSLLGAIDLAQPAGPPGMPGLGALALCGALFLFAACVVRRQPGPARLGRAGEKRRLAKRTALAAALILLLIPLTLFVGVFCLEGKKYYFISLLILLEILTPFFLVFEGRKPQARELVVIGVLCAIGVAGRAAFFMLPQFKPVMALTILAGVAFGGETGFLVGALTMLASNALFSQGPWTPWQMFAMGIIGFLAGVLFRKGLLGRNRASLSVFGALAALFLYGGIMNFASALMWTGQLNWSILLSYWATGFPMDCVHAAATWFFLWFGGEPMLEKLDRIQTKYGLLQ